MPPYRDIDRTAAGPAGREARERSMYAALGGDPAHFDPVPEYLRRWFERGTDEGGVASAAALLAAGVDPELTGLAREWFGSGQMSQADRDALPAMPEVGEEEGPTLSPEMMARLVEELGQRRMWTPPPEWNAPAPAVPAPTAPPAALWSAATPYARMGDAFAALRRTPGLGAAVPSEERSLSDRLRPPYVTPIPGANPANAGMAAILERAFGSLPPAAQGAFRQGGTPLDVGRLPSGAFPGGALESGAWPRTLWAGTEEETRQQLLRELMERGR